MERYFIDVFILGFLGYFFCLFGTTHGDDGKPEYKFVLDKFEQETKSEDIFQIDLKLEDEGTISGEVKQLMDLDNNWKVVIEILHANSPDEEYKKVFGVPQKGVCDVMKSFYKLYFYDSIKNYANAPAPETCPVTKETYLIKQYPLDSSKFQKLLKPGHYKAIGTLLQEGVEKIKCVVYGHVEEAK